MERPRRDYGTGSVFQDGQGQWWARIPLGNGKTRRSRCATAKEAEAKVERWIKEQEAGTNLRTAQLSVKSWLERWLTDLQATGDLAPRTIEFYTRHAEYAVTHLGSLALEALEPQHWRDARVKLLKAGLGRRSVNHVHAVLHTALEQAVVDRAIQQNPMKLVKRLELGKQKFEARVLDPVEIAALERACEDERVGVLLMFILDHGVRNGEARALKRADVDLARRCFTVKDAKTKSGVRRIDLTDAWVARLQAHFATLEDEREIARRRDIELARADAQLAPGQPIPLRRLYRDQGYVFPSEAGTKLGEQNLNKIKQRILKRAGLCDPCPDCGQTGQVAGKGKGKKPARCERCLGRGVILWRIRIHDLRHTAITDWIAEGEADPKTAQGMAGHSSAATTMDIYAKTRESKQRDVLERVEAKRRKKTGGE